MRILNFGSLNIDYVYEVPHAVSPGETLSSLDMHVFAGGKGLNQSIALARAGAEVFHAGQIGAEGDFLRELLEESGICTRYVRSVPGHSGHAIIQLDHDHQNCILLYGGANQQITAEYAEEVLKDFSAGDILLLQNEISAMDHIINIGAKKGMKIVLNPSPFNEKLQSCDLSKIAVFLVNEIEGQQLTGEREPKKILAAMRAKFPGAEVILTLGDEGSIYQREDYICRQEVIPVKAVDTTAAGDTYTGYFLASRMEGCSIQESMKRAAKAASIAVSRHGAAPSIPVRGEVI